MQGKFILQSIYFVVNETDACKRTILIWNVRHGIDVRKQFNYLRTFVLKKLSKTYPVRYSYIYIQTACKHDIQNAKYTNFKFLKQ